MMENDPVGILYLCLKLLIMETVNYNCKGSLRAEESSRSLLGISPSPSRDSSARRKG